MSKRRFRPTDAFVDESIRGRWYLMRCVLVEARHVGAVRSETAALAADGKRRHFSHDTPEQRRDALRLFAQFPIRALVTVCVRTHGVTQFVARAACLAEIVRRLQSLEVPRLTIESRQDDRDDQRSIQRVRSADPLLVFEHVEPLGEPILWIADAVTWAVGAGAPSSSLVEPILAEVAEVQP